MSEELVGLLIDTGMFDLAACIKVMDARVSLGTSCQLYFGNSATHVLACMRSCSSHVCTR